jgi:hypothetical protein
MASEVLMSADYTDFTEKSRPPKRAVKAGVSPLALFIAHYYQ